MARKKVAPEEKIVNAVGEETALGSVPADTAPPDETGADSGDFPAELPEGDLPAEETAEQSETLPAMEAAEAKPLGLSTEEKTTSQDESDTAEERAEEAEPFPPHPGSRSHPALRLPLAVSRNSGGITPPGNPLHLAERCWR